MSKFCGTCGFALNDGQKFCGKCGSPNPPAAQATASTENVAPTTQPSYVPVPVAPTASSAAPARSNALLKIAVAAIVIIFVGGLAAAGAVYYAVHKVKEKVQASMHGAAENPSSEIASLLQKAAAAPSGESGESDDGSFKGDPCRFLSKGDVSGAIGVEIVRAEGKDEGCTYIAKGDPADMVSKHMTSMITSQAKSNGTNATPDQTKLMQQITGAFFKQSESSDKELSKAAAVGEVPVLTVSFSKGNAEAEMKMNRMAFNHIKGSNADGATTDQSATGDLDGIGDDAYEMGGSGIIFRKGGTVVHMMFTECPCDAHAVKPLAVRIAGQL